MNIGIFELKQHINTIVTDYQKIINNTREIITTEGRVFKYKKVLERVFKDISDSTTNFMLINFRKKYVRSAIYKRYKRMKYIYNIL